MSDSICPYCKKEVDEGAKICENCGEWIIKPNSEPKPAPKKKKVKFSSIFILVFIAAVVVSCFTFFSKQRESSSEQVVQNTAVQIKPTKTKTIKPTTQAGAEEEPTVATVYELKYEVSGTAVTYDYSYTGENGETVEEKKVRLPSKISFNVTSGSQFVASLTAKNNGTFGTIVCRIYIDGEMVAETKNSEENGSVSCSYNID